MLSNTCSGTPQSALEFSQTFGKFHGTAPTASSSTAVQPAVADTNPADAPYPLWNASTNYPAGRGPARRAHRARAPARPPGHDG
jgi:hypothetical protein